MIGELPTRVLREHETGTRTTETYDELTFGPVKDQEEWHVRYIAAQDETTDVALVVPYVVTPGVSYPLPGWTQTDKTEAYCDEYRVIMQAGDFLKVRFYDGAESDVLKAWLYGQVYELRPVVPAIVNPEEE